MTYAIARFLRIVVPAASLLIIVILTWGKFWHVVLGILVVLIHGWFMEWFGAYEYYIEQIHKRQKRHG